MAVFSVPKCAAEVEHVLLRYQVLRNYLDSNGDRRLATLRGSNAVPPPAAVIRTSIGKYQVIWRVKGFTIPEQEAMLNERKRIARRSMILWLTRLRIY